MVAWDSEVDYDGKGEEDAGGQGHGRRTGF